MTYPVNGYSHEARKLDNGTTGYSSGSKVYWWSSDNQSWSDEKLLPGDVIESLRAGNFIECKAPYSGGTAGLPKEICKLFRGEGVELLVRRARRRTSLPGRVLQDLASVLKKQYVLAAFIDPNHILVLEDAREDIYLHLQEKRQNKVEEARKSRESAQRKQLTAELVTCKLKDAYTPSYLWQLKTESHLLVPGSCTIFSLLRILYHSYVMVYDFLSNKDTSARALARFLGAQSAGIPMVFSHIPSETVFLQVPSHNLGGPREDITNVATKSYCAMKENDVTDVEMWRAIRLWYESASPETAMELKTEKGEKRLGVSISRTEKGFCHITSVEPDTPAARTSKRTNHIRAKEKATLLVLSRVCRERVTPWVVCGPDSSGVMTPSY